METSYFCEGCWQNVDPPYGPLKFREHFDRSPTCLVWISIFTHTHTHTHTHSNTERDTLKHRLIETTTLQTETSTLQPGSQTHLYRHTHLDSYAGGSRTFRHRTFRHRTIRHNHLVTWTSRHTDIWSHWQLVTRTFRHTDISSPDISSQPFGHMDIYG